VNVNDQKPIEFLSFWEQFLLTLRQRTEKITSVQNLQAGPYHVMGSPIAIQTVLFSLWKMPWMQWRASRTRDRIERDK